MKPILFVGGTGAVGSRAVRGLRLLYPSVPIAIGARDLARAEALANEVGAAHAVRVTLERPDLGLPASFSPGAVVALLKDERLSTLDFAQRQQVPYLGFSDFVFDVGPAVARHVARPDASAILLGQFLGGTVSLATLHAARHFAELTTIAVGGVLDEDDTGGPVAQEDFARLVNAPRALLRVDGRFVWATDATASRAFVDSDGVERAGTAAPLLDVASLAAATGARSVRVDLAFRPATEVRESRRARSNETIIEMRGTRTDGAPGALRVELIDRDTYSATSARGVVIAVERLLGLTGEPPVRPGLHQPETILEPAHVVQRLRAFGVSVRELPVA